LLALYRIVDAFFLVYTLLIVVRIFLSWIPHDYTLFIFNFIYDVTEPVLDIFRRLIPVRVNLPLDFSPLLAIIALQLLKSLLLNLIGKFI